MKRSTQIQLTFLEISDNIRTISYYAFCGANWKDLGGLKSEEFRGQRISRARTYGIPLIVVRIFGILAMNKKRNM